MGRQRRRFTPEYKGEAVNLVINTGKATTATIRDQLINIPGRLARSARRLMIHLPTDWPWEHPWTELFTTAHGPPAALAT